MRRRTIRTILLRFPSEGRSELLKLSNTALLAFLALLWLQLFYALAPTWSDGTYYDYGWLVGPLAVLFFYRRWQEHGADRDHDRMGRQPARHRWLWVIVVGALLFLVPLRVVQQVDLYWRLPLWLHAGVAFGITHLLLALHLSWRTSCAVLPATLFALLALPIPSVIESGLVQGLTHRAVTLSKATLPYLGYPVDVAGNSLIVRGELLDVAEGCSGIRSFQSCAMAALCLGELLRFPLARRVLLVAFGFVLAITCNAGRVVILARIAHDHGRVASDAAHDTVGFWVLIITYGGLSLCAWGLSHLGRNPKSIARGVISQRA